MPHLDPDRLALLALDDEPVDPVESDHLADCSACRAEVDSLREVVTLGAEAQEVRELAPPPERVWRQIATEVAAGEPNPARHTVVPIRSAQRWRNWVRPALVAAAAVVFAVAATIVVIRPWQRAADADVRASADLVRLPTAAQSLTGNARVLTGAGGERLHLHIAGLPLTTGYYEVWLIDPDTKQMISVGVVPDASDVLLPLPGTVDLKRYRLVDVSAEQYDGNTAHSGQSLLRGILTG